MWIRAYDSPTSSAWTVQAARTVPMPPLRSRLTAVPGRRPSGRHRAMNTCLTAPVAGGSQRAALATRDQRSRQGRVGVHRLPWGPVRRLCAVAGARRPSPRLRGGSCQSVHDVADSVRDDRDVHGSMSVPFPAGSVQWRRRVSADPDAGPKSSLVLSRLVRRAAPPPDCVAICPESFTLHVDDRHDTIYPITHKGDGWRPGSNGHARAVALPPTAHLIERQPHPTDRHTKELVLTPAGEHRRADALERLNADSPPGHPRPDPTGIPARLAPSPHT